MKINILSTGAILAIAVTETIAAATAIQPSSSAAAALSSLGVSVPSGKVQVGNVRYTCNLLDRVFSKNETFTADDSFYDPLINEAWSQNCRLDAACIVTPNSAQEVSRLIRILSILNTKFSIRSGGHMTSPGFSSVGGNGVLVALEKLNSLSLSSDKKTVTIGPGNRWQNVYEYLEPYGLTTLGGRTPVVGIGGYVLGGGLSTFYNTYGLAVDSVSRFQVVLADGTIVNATPTEHADLYKGLKGGLNNFGIITEYDLPTNSGLDIYFEVKTYSAANTPAVLAAYADYLQDADINSNVEVQINPTYTLVFYGYLGHVSTPTAFDLFTDIPAASTLYPPTNGSLTELLLGFGDAGLTDDGISHSGTFSHKVTDSKFLKESYEVYQKAVASLPSGAVLSYVPQGVIPNLVTKGKSQNGGNLLGLEATPQVWANIFVQFPENVTESVATGAVDDAIEKLTSSAKSQELFLPYIFVNDAGPEQKPLQSFGKENLNYIKKVAKKYDPRGIMQKLQNKAYFVSE